MLDPWLLREGPLELADPVTIIDEAVADALALALLLLFPDIDIDPDIEADMVELPLADALADPLGCMTDVTALMFAVPPPIVL